MDRNLNDSELTTLRNRFKKDAEFLLQGTALQQENDKSAEEKEQPPLPRVTRHTVFWILASVAVTYYTDFCTLILETDDVHRWWLGVGLALLALCISLALFCIVYLEWFKGIKHYDQVYPAIPAVTTAAFIAASCSLNVALWPLWSIFTPLILFTQFMGLVMFISILG